MTTPEHKDEKAPRPAASPRWVTPAAIAVILLGIAGVAAVVSMPVSGAQADSPIVYTTLPDDVVQAQVPADEADA